MDTYPGREVYERAPLEFVACEIRYPLTPALGRDDVAEKMPKEVLDRLPIPKQEQLHSVTIGPGQASSSPAEARFRFLNRQRTQSAVVGRSTLTIETTAYSEYQEFRSLLLDVVSAVEGMAQIVGVERVGIRYINEIRVDDEIKTVRDWRAWVSQDALAVLNVADDLSVSTLESVLRMESEDSHLTVRLAALSGAGVVGNEPLRRRSQPADGPFFVVDIDSYWGPSEDMMDFESDKLVSLVDRLHLPVGSMFQSVLTDKVRDEFRRPE
jgi:uncharacterized protein (TIGR04255 family)